MKAMKKVLALGLALAMVVTAVPVTSAEAASAKLPAKKTYYVGKTNTLKLNATKVKKTAWSKTGAAVKLSAKAKKSVKVTAVKAGTSTVKAKVTYTTGKSKTYSCKVTVKNPVLTVPETATVIIGETTSAKATKKAPSTATVAYKSADEKIATVDAKTGKVTGVKAGTTTITATLTCGTKKVVKKTTVTVDNKIAAVKVVKPAEINVTFAGALESIARTDVTIKDAKNNSVVVKSAALDEAKKIVTITTYSALTSGTTYTVSVAVGDKAYTETFDYVKGSVASIEVEDQMVQANTWTTVKYKVLDENGLDLTDETTVVVQTTAPVSGSSINTQVMLVDKAVAYAKVVYTNPTNGTTKESAQFKITGAVAVAKSIDAITVITSGAATLTKTTWPKTVDTVVEKSEASSKVNVLYTPTYGDQVVTTAGIKSLNPEIAVVDVATGVVTPIKEGTATIVVKVGDVSAEYALTVVGDPKETSLKLNADKSKTTTSLTVNNAGAGLSSKVCKFFFTPLSVA